MTNDTISDSNDETFKNSNIEDIFIALEEVMSQLERADISLEESFRLYRQGMDMLKLCNEKIDTVEKKVMMLDDSGESHEF
ncbi:MAG: exodeoxyribonuclease VII small subunit [Lachnospiraceae bacterium]|nr:exodeoxyribonuclease VII small subunit [Lachnospiraceae bacterium]